MASTRQPPLMRIYQDSVSASFEYPRMPNNLRPLAPTSSPLFPVENPAVSKNMLLNPPVSGTSKPAGSPLKSSRKSNSPPKAVFSSKFNVSLPPPKAPDFITDSPRKPPAFSTFNTAIPHKPQKAMFTTFPSTIPMNKENVGPGVAIEPPAPFPDPSCNQKGPMKRPLAEAAPPQDRQAKKQKAEAEPAPPFELPEPGDMPDVEDDGGKPPYSYAILIGMAILRAPNRRLTLAQIYKWISDTFAYYRTAETGWQNSIRHNLSLNKAFVKQERPKDDPGKGNYWALEAGMEHQFMKEKPIRKLSHSGPAPLVPLQPAAKKQSLHHPHVPTDTTSDTSILPPIEAVTAELPETRLAEGLELSSDATVAASEIDQDDEPENYILAVPLPHPVNSSPPQIIHSSPPIVRHVRIREATPPPIPHFPSSSSRSRKRNFMTMNDSGYFSSIESSAIRPHKAGAFLTSEADIDRPKIKRGRAEEEIVRLRHSSHDSPSKGRTTILQPTPLSFSSSPTHGFPDTNNMALPPLTPATTFKMPPRPPQSVSPNTNLRNHRAKIQKLLGSPIRGMDCLEDESPWDTTFGTLDDSQSFFEDYNSFYIFADDNKVTLPGSATGSPEKRSIKRPHLDRAITTGSVLTDITGLSGNLNITKPSASTSAPFKTAPSHKPHNKLSDPSGERVGLAHEDVFGLDFFSDEPSDFPGVDILLGFEKIGGGVKDERKHPQNENIRPTGRNFNSQF